MPGMRSRVEGLGGTLEAAGPAERGFRVERRPARAEAAREPRVRVALVDDQPLVRMGLATLIASEDGVELVGEAGDGRAGLGI